MFKAGSQCIQTEESPVEKNRGGCNKTEIKERERERERLYHKYSLYWLSGPLISKQPLCSIEVEGLEDLLAC